MRRNLIYFMVAISLVISSTTFITCNTIGKSDNSTESAKFSTDQTDAKNSSSPQRENKIIAEAVQQAENFLGLIDQGKYDESYNVTASFFQSQVKKDVWNKLLEENRKPLGSVKTRIVDQKQYYTKLPNAPNGEYVVIQFTTSFENKADSIETVTPMLDQNGEWKVAGYYIK